MRKRVLFCLVAVLCALLSRPRADGLAGLSVCAAVYGLLVPTAQAQVRGTIIEPGERKFPIAVSPLKSLSSDTESVRQTETFADIIARDLTISGFFRVIPRDTYIEAPDTSGITEQTINFDDWTVIGALTLVKGSLLREGDGLTIEARLFDVYQRRQLVGRRYRGQLHDVRRMAHRFADEIMAQQTGERGPFDSRIVFLSRRGGRFKDVYVMSVDGGDVQRVTAANTLNLSPSWGPDLQSILFTSYVDGNPDLFSIRLDGTHQKRISGARGLNLGGRWSPDGTRIAVTHEEDGNSDIFVLDANGTVQKRLTDHQAIDVSPSWSPDGRRVAFCSRRSGSPQIYVASADGTNLRRLTYEGDYNTSPAWSPRGERIAYVSRRQGRFEIFTIRTDGEDVRRVTENAGNNEDPSWSPDGRYLVFSSTRSGRSRLYVSDWRGMNQVELTGGEGDDTSPSWSRWLD